MDVLSRAFTRTSFSLTVASASLATACMGVLGIDFDPKLRETPATTEPTDPRDADAGGGESGGAGEDATSRPPVSAEVPAPRLSTSNRHACALDRAGVAWCWGDPGPGQLGAGRLYEWQAAPVRVEGLEAPATAIAANGRTSCAVAAERLYCWGDLLDGQTARERAEEKKGLPSVVRVAVGPAGSHACVATRGGDVWCWGSNRAGELGRVEASIAGQAAAVGLRGVTALALGMSTTCAVNGDAVQCWGNNANGILGVPYFDKALSPIPHTVAFGALVGNQVDAMSVVAGNDHACALGRDSSVWCWGSHYESQLGSEGTQKTKDEIAKTLYTPVRVPDVGDRVLSISAGAFHTCALLAGGTVSCWGANTRGQLGSVTAAPRSDVPRVVPSLEGIVEIAAGGERTCARARDGRISCWGAWTNPRPDAGANEEPPDSIAPVFVSRIE